MSTTTQTASSPFDDKGAWDTILRTSDDINFHVHSAILGFVSPYFREMFSLPREDNVVPVAEDSTALDLTLRFVYPGQAPPALTTWKDVSSVYRAFTVYRMESTAAFPDIARHLREMSLERPADLDLSNIPKGVGHSNWEAYSVMRVFGIMQMLPESFTKDSIDEAFEKTLTVPFHELATAYVQELDGMTVKDFIKLLRRHRYERLMEHTPSFTADDKENTRWKYHCHGSYDHRGEAPDTDAQLDPSKVKEWYESKLVPMFQNWENMDTIALLPYEPTGWTCSNCSKKRCRYMLQAATSIFRTEIGLALSQNVFLVQPYDPPFEPSEMGSESVSDDEA
ncbi:hypothetical protein VNI00_016281 [Paramarasmius palmivorus]|uniref:BTB domain-containing protein n=1 Tax=Paramarasmius palmivorus TaxID=297713 RepID=A0AAW0BFB2_9AGAR